jgi:hypothetical protein
VITRNTWSIPLSAALVALLLGGCQSLLGAQPEPAPTGQLEDLPSSDAPEEEEAVASPPPEFIPGGSAAQNEAYFLYVLTEAGAGSERVLGADVRQAVVDAGFDDEAIEITSDTSLIRLPAESITIAVAMDGECLVGQWGKDWLVTQVTPLLDTGVCLVGDVDSLD